MSVEPPVSCLQRSSTISTSSLSWSADTGAIRLGWVNVVIGAVVMLATLPGRTQGLGLITEPLLADLQLDRIAYANINLWATLLGAAICLPIGRVFDRVGLRWATAALTSLALVVAHERADGRSHDAVRADSADPGDRSERAVGGEYHGGREIVRRARRHGDGRLLGAAQRLLCIGLRRHRRVSPNGRLADGVDAGSARPCVCRHTGGCPVHAGASGDAGSTASTQQSCRA